VPVIFTASETFDVGMDLGSPVSLDYHERAPFKFNGQIEKINIKYIWLRSKAYPWGVPFRVNAPDGTPPG